MQRIIIGFLITVTFTETHAMIRALHTAATGMAAQETSVSTISNNIANVNTIGYKKQRAETESLLYETIIKAGARSSYNSRYNTGVQIGSGSKVSSIKREFTSGIPQVTNNPFDLMIDGDGFFGLSLPNQNVTYTRDGAFNVNAQGVLVNKHGYVVVPTLSFPTNTMTVSISENGQVEAYIKNQLEPVSIGQIPVFTFTNPSGLNAVGGNMYKPTLSSGQAITNNAGESNSGRILQGTLEASNVSIMNEMTNLIKAQRGYEMNAKVMKVADEMLQTINTVR